MGRVYSTRAKRVVPQNVSPLTRARSRRDGLSGDGPGRTLLGAVLGALLGAFEDLDEPPALCRRQRAGLHQRDPVADPGVAVLVVRLDLLGGPDDLAVQRVVHPVF